MRIGPSTVAGKDLAVQCAVEAYRNTTAEESCISRTEQMLQGVRLQLLLFKSKEPCNCRASQSKEHNPLHGVWLTLSLSSRRHSSCRYNVQLHVRLLFLPGATDTYVVSPSHPLIHRVNYPSGVADA